MTYQAAMKLLEWASGKGKTEQEIMAAKLETAMQVGMEMNSKNIDILIEEVRVEMEI